MNHESGSAARVHELLHTSLDEIHARPDLYDRVRAGARNRRRARTGSAAVALASVAACAFAFLPGDSADSRPLSEETAPSTLTCPATPNPVIPHPSGRSGAQSVLVPGTPVVATACMYDVTHSGNQGRFVLARTRHVTGDQLAAVVASLQRPVAPYDFYCPAGPYPALEIHFRYSEGPDVTVYVSRGCPELSNGTLSGTFDQHGTLPSAIAALTQ